ncbi:MAG: hypothetical protein A2Y54_00905 [Chloroflexi bacterium RBG_16_51_16]|nr:MAG: hypothetical protein A2Y54_00905 [Chloroflexi bacterium RBG_16_51_16]
MRSRTRFPWEFILALLIGLGLGLTYAWFITPVEYVNAQPSQLRSDFKDEYRGVIAAAYAANRNLDRARARLSLLADPDPVQALSAQAQQMLAAGISFNQVSQVAQLAADIQSGAMSPTIISTSQIVEETVPTSQTEVQGTTLPTFGESTSTQSSGSVIDAVTITPRPTTTPTFTPGPAFALVAQEPKCEPNKSRGLLQITVMDARKRQVPGVEIIVTWNGGEDRFFTGFKPEMGNGYADFQMTVSTAYNVRVVEGGTQVPNVTAPPCSNPNGSAYTGDLLLTFQQP